MDELTEAKSWLAQPVPRWWLGVAAGLVAGFLL